MANEIERAALAKNKRKFLKEASSTEKTVVNYLLPSKGLFASRTRVADAEYDAVVESIAKERNSFNRALDKIGIDARELREMPPVALAGYEQSALSRVTDSGEYRSELYSVAHLLFSAERIYCYKVTFDMLCGEKKETFLEYAYSQISETGVREQTIKTFSYSGKKVEEVEVRATSLVMKDGGKEFVCPTVFDLSQRIEAIKHKIAEKV